MPFYVSVRMLDQNSVYLRRHHVMWRVGVVDSSDIPLNVSRETMQDTALIRRIRSVLTRKVLKYAHSGRHELPDS